MARYEVDGPEFQVDFATTEKEALRLQEFHQFANGEYAVITIKRTKSPMKYMDSELEELERMEVELNEREGHHIGWLNEASQGTDTQTDLQDESDTPESASHRNR